MCIYKRVTVTMHVFHPPCIRATDSLEVHWKELLASHVDNQNGHLEFAAYMWHVNRVKHPIRIFFLSLHRAFFIMLIFFYQQMHILFNI